MSSSRDAGYYVDKAYKTTQTKCINEKSPNKEHKWIKHGSWPSQWEECDYCKQTIYWK